MLSLLILVLILGLIGWAILAVLDTWGAPPIARTVTIVVLVVILLCVVAHAFGVVDPMLR